MAGICLKRVALAKQLGHALDQCLPSDVPPRRVMIAPDLKQIAHLVIRVTRVPAFLQMPKHQLQIRFGAARPLTHCVGGVVGLVE
jgi:hypothetical protein